ncbi:DNA repair protein SWI5 homolog [Neocloeon triangulifer]|uniref:DNA repair protein SWI5 homolog n=1 Tax=Neocloeon triangulifer TaxID=2078957 RepID=UPI00286F03FD|nr:DNA repair protein SWI5 homolog [Neocloeon triangulifer]
MSGPDNKVLAKLQKEEAKLTAELEALKSVVAEQTSKEVLEELKKKHIDALHEYNDVKDAAQAVLGVLANHEQVTVREMHENYDLPTKKDE